MSYYICELPEKELKAAFRYFEEIGCDLSTNARKFMAGKRKYKYLLMTDNRSYDGWDVGVSLALLPYMVRRSVDEIVEHFSDKI